MNDLLAFAFTSRALHALGAPDARPPRTWFNWALGRGPETVQRLQVLAAADAETVRRWLRRLQPTDTRPVLVVGPGDKLPARSVWPGLRVLSTDGDFDFRPLASQPDDVVVEEWRNVQLGGGLGLLRARPRPSVFWHAYGEALAIWRPDELDPALASLRSLMAAWPANSECLPASAFRAQTYLASAGGDATLWWPVDLVPCCAVGIAVRSGQLRANGWLAGDVDERGTWRFDPQAVLRAELKSARRRWAEQHKVEGEVEIYDLFELTPEAAEEAARTEPGRTVHELLEEGVEFDADLVEPMLSAGKLGEAVPPFSLVGYLKRKYALTDVQLLELQGAEIAVKSNERLGQVQVTVDPLPDTWAVAVSMNGSAPAIVSSRRPSAYYPWPADGAVHLMRLNLVPYRVR